MTENEFNEMFQKAEAIVIILASVAFIATAVFTIRSESHASKRIKPAASHGVPCVCNASADEGDE